MMGRTFATLSLAVSLVAVAFAQDGVSTASYARTKMLGKLGEIPTSREIAVEEFVNYHRHELPRPKSGQAVAMDVRWQNNAVREGDEAILQVGFSTTLVGDRQNIRPLNLALVIDKSGSMADHDKLERVKQALLTLVSRLRPTDTLSLVTFDTSARVVVPAHQLGDGKYVEENIQALQPGSSTNIEAGLMLGYKEALKHLSRESTNRVILLTDGIANQGVIDSQEIVRESQSYNDQGIDLSTIGVGEDLNKDLLRDLAKSGRGLFHFIADDEDVQKIFVNELQSLVSPVAENPDLKIEYGPGLQLEKVYGYEPKLGRNSVRIHLDTMNSGMTEVVLLRFRTFPGDRTTAAVKAHLSYGDRNGGETQSLSDDTVLKISSERRDADDPSVTKNLTIAELAQSIKDMAVACEGKDYLHAEAIIAKAVDQTEDRYPNLEDPDIKRPLAMAVKYQSLLAEQVPSEEPIASERSLQEPQVRFPYIRRANLVPNGDFEQGNTGFISDREYIKPSPNCLWGTYYTVVTQFNSPVQLHTNVVAQPFAAPHGGQVMFMNSGGRDQFTVWSAHVRCKAHTKYRISFQEIGLSGGPEWDNLYEIRIGRDRSEAQLGGEGKYAEISYEWDSGATTGATLTITRLPNPHNGGVIGIANIEMVKE